MAEPLIGYCTNVHAGADLDQTRRSLQEHATAVRARFSPDAALPIGLWLSDTATRQLGSPESVAEFRSWLDERRLSVFTLNGFPYHDFHQPVVKHAVYRPTWSDPERLDYTCRLADLLVGLAPGPGDAGISTLPIGWPSDFTDPDDLVRAGRQLRQAADHLARLESTTGRCVHLDLEPEPGCVLSKARDVVTFFERYLLGHADEAVVRRHLRVCHDVCHAAVMYEDQAAQLVCYADAGIAIGKVQISSAVRAVFDDLDRDARDRLRSALAGFCEPRYLHQTVIRTDAGFEFHEDLDLPLSAGGPALTGEWRVHFHVPIHLEALGPLQTTRDQIVELLDLAASWDTPIPFEIETYAWNVLDPSYRGPSLADDIAMELRWLRDLQLGGNAP